MIISHNGQTILVRGGGTDTAITLTDTTAIQAVVGVIGVRKEDHPATDLIAGLAVSVETVQNGSELDAASVTFMAGDPEDRFHGGPRPRCIREQVQLGGGSGRS